MPRRLANSHFAVQRMRILVLTKRQYMGKDMLDDRFGRFRELPLELNGLGHEVAGLAISYRQRPVGVTLDNDPSRSGRVTWHCENATQGIMPRFCRVTRAATQLVRDYKPDIIWAASDAYVVTFGTWLAKRSRTCCVIDLYDNFEAFSASKLPGVRPLFRRAVRNAEGVTCFSERMADYIARSCLRTKPTATIENGQRNDLFFPQERDACRRRVGLPQDATIVGTAGALDPSRGIETLFTAIKILENKKSDVHLALAGPRKPSLDIPNGPKVHDLKALPHEQVPLFINALNLAVICYRHSAQGEVSFPQKAYEIIACRVPLVAAAVGSMNELLVDYPQCLYEPENPESLVEAVERQLLAKTIVNIAAPSWADSAKKLAVFFDAVLRGPA
jgi:glycosyltransferase involved in cell wall biosynthesis